MADAEDKVCTGACYCGAVTNEANGLSDICYCHCAQCRSLMGHHMAAAGGAHKNFGVQSKVTWTRVLKEAEHGFCKECYSSLFWSNDEQATVSIGAGNLHDTSALAVKGHIFVAEKSDYDEITDGLPLFCGYHRGRNQIRQAVAIV